MNYYNYIRLELLLDDIDEIVTKLLNYLFNKEPLNDIEVFNFAIKSIPEKIAQIKEIIEMELINNESYFESQNES